MEKIKPRTLSGFLELLPERESQMQAIQQILRDTYSLFGFTPIDTPIMEASEVLLAKGGGETEKQIYRFEKGDSDLSLRFDLTVPLAKYVAMNAGQLAFPFRRYQIGKVYRGERAQRGRFREFYQADVDVIGDGTLDPSNEAEMVAIICTVFSRLGLDRFQVRINNRKLLNGLFTWLGLGNKAQAVMTAIDKLDKIGPEKVAALLVENLDVAPDIAEKLMNVVSAPDPAAMLDSLEGSDPALDEGIRELRLVTGLLPSFGVPADKWRLDLTIARGLDYYTGTVYETTLLDHPEVGSVCSGGRYDDLAAYYTDRKLPGVGVSIGVSRLFFILQDQGLLRDEAIVPPCDALVIPMGDVLDWAVQTATILRNTGIRSQIYMEQKKAKAKFAYADKLNIPFAVVVGEDERNAGTVSLKDLRTGEQQTLTPAQAAEAIHTGLPDRGKPVQEGRKQE
ncbi:MAG: histidine--tRNA ligase [Oscillospiraceae bacterium]|nr:histidine--tRNA ligase [Oscillospiraceae bacterium]